MIIIVIKNKGPVVRQMSWFFISTDNDLQHLTELIKREKEEGRHKSPTIRNELGDAGKDSADVEMMARK